MLLRRCNSRVRHLGPGTRRIMITSTLSMLTGGISARLRFAAPFATRMAMSLQQLSANKNFHTSPNSSIEEAPPPKELHPHPTFGEVDLDEDLGADPKKGLEPKMRALVQLYTAGCNHYWQMLPGLAQASYDRGATHVEVAATVRHLIVFAGYAPCLAATIALRQAGMLKGETVGKVGGPPGDAFEQVYDKVTDVVRGKLQGYDPVLAEYIRLHLYGDVYSSPGLNLQQKQLLTVSFLGEAAMHDQLYTHLIAALRFGASKGACEQAIRIGFHMSPRPAVVLRPIQRKAIRQLDKAVEKFTKDYPNGPPPMPQVNIPDPDSVRVPPLPPPVINKGK